MVFVPFQGTILYQIKEVPSAAYAFYWPGFQNQGPLDSVTENSFLGTTFIYFIILNILISKLLLS